MKNFGLKSTPKDSRDYHYKKTFGAAVVPLPAEYIVGVTPIKNQLESWFCTAFGSAILAELEDNAEFSPEWFFAKEKELSGSSLSEGEDIRTPFKTGTKYGFLPQNLAQNSVLTQTPIFLASSQNWPFSDDLGAAPYKKKSYFRVDGNFQEVKQVLYQNKDAKRAIGTGINWYDDWNEAPSGVVPQSFTQLGGGHFIPIIGWKTINGIEYMVIQNSWGPDVGDKGYYYFSEKIFNKIFTQPMFMFVDLDNTVVPKTLGNPLQILIEKICRLVLP